MNTDDLALRRSRARSRVLFLIAGGLLVLFAMNTGLETYGESAYPAARDVLGPAGFAISAVAFLFAVRAIGRERTRLVRAGAALAVVTAAGWSVVAAIGLGHTAGVLPDAEVVLPLVAFFALFLVTPLAFLTIGVGGVLADGIPTWLGLLLLLPAIPFLVLVLGGGLLGAVPWAEVVLDAGHAAANLVIGVAMFRARLLFDQAESASDAAS